MLGTDLAYGATQKDKIESDDKAEALQIQVRGASGGCGAAVESSGRRGGEDGRAREQADWTGGRDHAVSGGEEEGEGEVEGGRREERSGRAREGADLDHVRRASRSTGRGGRRGGRREEQRDRHWPWEEGESDHVTAEAREPAADAPGEAAPGARGPLGAGARQLRQSLSNGGFQRQNWWLFRVRVVAFQRQMVAFQARFSAKW
eukprot:3617254-Rhodomonas_salina.1